MARVRLAYPKIPGSSAAPLESCIAFKKYDGTNLHWVWERELGWYAFGMRRNRYDLDELGIAEFHEAHRGYTDAVQIFQSTLAQPLAELFSGHPTYDSSEITVFTEYVGSESFAGQHKESDTKRLVLFDVAIGDAILPPNQFIDEFSHLDTARVVYRGKLTGKCAEDVRQGRYDVDEGVVCKGGKTPDTVWMVKIKTNSYMDKLKQAFQGDWEDYWE